MCAARPNIWALHVPGDPRAEVERETRALCNFYQPQIGDVIPLLTLPRGGASGPADTLKTARSRAQQSVVTTVRMG